MASSFVEFLSVVTEKKSEMSQPIRGQGGSLGFPIDPTQIWYRILRCCFMESFVDHRSAIAEKKSKLSQSIRDQDGHLDFWSARKNTNLVGSIDFLLPVKFRWIQFSGCREEAENVSTNQRPGWSSWFSDRFEKHKLCRGCCDLASS